MNPYEITNIDKVLFLGTYPETFPAHNPAGKITRNMPIFCKVSYTTERKAGKLTGKLSISGVIAPIPNGDAWGSCGQINDDIRQNLRRIIWAKDWSRAKAAIFLVFWDEWHLNDMRAGCEHQTAEHWGEAVLELITWRLNAETLRKQNTIKVKAQEDLEAMGTVNISAEEQAIIKAPWEMVAEHNPNPNFYKEHKRETKTAGWVYQTGDKSNNFGSAEHPQGVLGKPCPKCGYKYGTAWKTQEVPQDVLRFLRDLPDSERKPAWV